MEKTSLTFNVIKKVQMVKLIFDLATDCFKIQENTEKIGVGIILIQDAVELFILALCEHVGADNKPNMPLGELIGKLEAKINKTIILKSQILNINKQRVNIKHLGFLPNISNCLDFIVNTRTFFQENSEVILKCSFDSITLIDLIKKDSVKKLLQKSQENLLNGEYKECQINCRKALYNIFECRFSIKEFQNKENDRIKSILGEPITEAPFYTRNKEYIEENVKEPVDYICLDFDKLDKELLMAGISPVDYWNIWRLTPRVYFDNVENEWVIQEDFSFNRYNEQNAEYCFRKTTDIILLKEKDAESQRSVEHEDGIDFLRLKDGRATVYKKATSNSEVVHSLKDFSDELLVLGKTRALDEKKHYYRICSNFTQKNHPFIYGYICEDDTTAMNRHNFNIAKDQ